MRKIIEVCIQDLLNTFKQQKSEKQELRKESEADAKLKRQIYRDAYERNAIEGRNGSGKRRFGLDRIFSKLDKAGPVY